METRVPLPPGFCPRVSVDGQAEAYLPAVSADRPFPLAVIFLIMITLCRCWEII